MAQTEAAQTQAGRTILVLDGSGSMWGQIDGRPKLDIAREMVGRVLAGFSADRELGLMAYGHRRRGDCSDIEVIVPPAPGTAARIVTAANAMRFQGRTPLTDAVRQAARELNFTEDPATVVLVTDGIETCAADPCALARELARTGVDFTAHVVGFGLTADEGAQVACLARETGGQYLLAANAEELLAALSATVTASPVASAPAGPWYPGLPDMPGVSLSPTGGTVPGNPAPVAEFDFPADGSAARCRALCDDDTACHAFRHEPAGTYFVDHARCFLYDAGAEFDWSRDSDFTSGLREGHLALIRPLDETAIETLPGASLTGPAEVTALAPFAVEVSGPFHPEDYVDVVYDGQTRVGDYLFWVMLRDGNPAQLIAPVEPGDYLVRYIEARDGQAPRVLATAALSVAPGIYALQAAGTVMGGALLRVEWQAPPNAEDWIDIAPDGSVDSGAYLSWTGVNPEGAPVDLVAPSAPGPYALRFVAAGPEGARVMLSRPLVVTAPEATLLAPERVAAGAVYRVGWSGPFHPQHYIALTAPDAGETDYAHGYFSLAAPGMPGELMAPEAPGRYELRFVLYSDGVQVIARRPLEVVPAETLGTDKP